MLASRQLRRGGAGSNTVADHLEGLEAAITALPPACHRRLMVTCDGAGASHGLIARLDALATRPGHQPVYSVGWDLGERERTAIAHAPEDAWQIALDHRGEVRERRTDDACPDACCAHRRSWIEEAHVTELTGLLRQGRAGDQLAGWPTTMRIFARRERPHPGAQLTLFEADDGWRYCLWVTNLPQRTGGWRGQPASRVAGAWRRLSGTRGPDPAVNTFMRAGAHHDYCSTRIRGRSGIE